ncbi:MAG: sialidase family protein [Gemmatimonadota bacterium]
MPHLGTAAGGGVLLSWLAPEAVSGVGEGPGNRQEQVLKVVRYRADEGFGVPSVVARGSDFFVNWADFPSVVEVGPGRWVAHWLQRGDQGGYDYGIRVATSQDAGATWSTPWTPHEDGTPTEHGFVTVWGDGEGGWELVWLDGRRYADGPDGPATREMTLRSRHVTAGDDRGPETLLDPRTCDWCQTDVAVTRGGPVVVYRDRSEEEVRDIYLSRRVQGVWTEGLPVHEDGWVIEGCPVNGPAVDAVGDTLAVAWFTAPREEPRVLLAFSPDGGETFGGPVRVDDGRPTGRTDVVATPDGSAVVLWLEDTGNGDGELRIRRVHAGGSVGISRTVTETRSIRASGFPQLAALGDGSFLVAWTSVSPEGTTELRTARVELP